jgi:acetylornithine/succinyldiaminopimelate/putrescine aminotransferase
MMGIGKGMSGGYAPLSALLWSERVASAFWGDESRKFDEGHTFNANPLSAAVGHAVLSYIIDNNLLENARTVGARMVELAQEVASRYEVFTEVQGAGLYAAMIIGRHPRTGDAPPNGWQFGRTLAPGWAPPWLAHSTVRKPHSASAAVTITAEQVERALMDPVGRRDRGNADAGSAHSATE